MAKTHEKNTLSRRSFKFAEEVMANLRGCQVCSHSLNTKCCDLAHGFEKPMQTILNTHTPYANKHGQITGFRLGSKDFYFFFNKEVM